jgi:subtilisin family serine protease
MNVLQSRTRVSVALLAGALLAAPSGAGAEEVAGQAIEGQHIVVLKDASSGAAVVGAKARVRNRGGSIQREFRHVLKGFSAKLTDKALAEVRSDPAVDVVEPDRVVTLDTTQSPATWGLDRIDQRSLPLNNSYVYNPSGAGVTAYIIDTGIRFTHNEFAGGRAVSGYDAVDGGSADDCNGHGTHVAGTVGGTTYGVAKAVRLVAVRVLNCSGSGSTSGVIAGIDWVTGNHAAGTPAVANMSLGGGASSALDGAVTTSINDGVTYAIAAGNSNANACNSSPARVGAAITVGSTTSSDARSSFSNYGSCVDIFAPGSSITSAWFTSNSATNTISGTSMATPHVAGAAALYLQGATGASPVMVRDALVAAASPVVTNPGSGSPNGLLYTGSGGPTPTPTPTPTPPPTGCGTVVGGSLSGTGASSYQPSSSGFTTTTSGQHKGCLTGPAGVDFDLYLQRWNGFGWSNVASGLGTTATETVTYSGSASTYRWRVYAYSGSGSYTLQYTRPN